MFVALTKMWPKRITGRKTLLRFKAKVHEGKQTTTFFKGRV